METDKKDIFSIENLLDDVQFSPSPAFQNRLHDRLVQQLVVHKKDQIMSTNLQVKENQNGRKHKTWHWVYSLAVVFCMVGVLIAVNIPAVRAQVKSIVQFFEIQLPFDQRGGAVGSSFTPLAPEKVPEQMKHFRTLNLEVDGSPYTELRYFSQDTFILIDEAPVEAGFVLPQGNQVKIGSSMDGVTSRDLEGVVFLDKEGPQPWLKPGNGGGGGEDDDAAGAPPQIFNYYGGTQITWVQGGLKIDLLTNLPYDQAISLAGSLAPAVQTEK